MEHHPTPKSTVDYMRKHKQGMFSKADKKLVKENSPAKSEALKKKGKEDHIKHVLRGEQKEGKISHAGSQILARANKTGSFKKK